MGSIPVAGEEKIRCPNMFSFVSFARMALDKSVRRPSDRDVNYRESQALKERLNKSYAKRAVTSFLKGYPCDVLCCKHMCIFIDIRILPSTTTTTK